MTSYEFWEELNKIFSAVISYQEKSIEFNNRFITPWIRLGNVFDKRDQSREKIDAYKKSLEMDPANVQNWIELGNLQMEANELEEALQSFKNAIALNPDLGWAYSNLGTVYMMMGDYENAIENFQRGITLLPDDDAKALAWNRLGTLYRKTQQYELALDAFRNADSLDTGCMQAPSGMEAVGESDSAAAPMPANDLIPSVPDGMELVTIMPDAANDMPSDESAQTATEAPVDEAATIEVGSQYPDVTETNTDAFPVVGTATLTNEPLLLEDIPASGAEPVAEEDSRPLTGEDNQPLLLEDIPVPSQEPAVEEDTLPLMVEAAQPVEEILLESVQAAPVVDQQTEEAIAPGQDSEVSESTDSVLELDPMITEIEEESNIDALEVELQEQAQVEPVLDSTEVEVTPEAESADPDGSDEAEEEPLEIPETLSMEAAEDSVVNAEATESREKAYEEYLLAENGLSISEDDQDNQKSPSATADPVTIIDSSGDVQMEVDINNAKVWNELGNVYYNNGAIEDAVLAYAKSIELDRQFAWPYSNLALAYVQKDRFAEAILLYQRSIELFTSEKDKAIAWNRLGNVYRRMDDYENAISAYQRADELDPGNISLAVQSRYSLLGTLTPSQATVTS
ncbi:MAG: tetratricopeptide repeat protein [Anaerolineales bacterium]|nr:tetratricopeptide repeat protein [Anaerolineales bacterium]